MKHLIFKVYWVTMSTIACLSCGGCFVFLDEPIPLYAKEVGDSSSLYLALYEFSLIGNTTRSFLTYYHESIYDTLCEATNIVDVNIHHDTVIVESYGPVNLYMEPTQLNSIEDYVVINDTVVEHNPGLWLRTYKK